MTHFWDWGTSKMCQLLARHCTYGLFEKIQTCFSGIKFNYQHEPLTTFKLVQTEISTLHASIVDILTMFSKFLMWHRLVFKITVVFGLWITNPSFGWQFWWHKYLILSSRSQFWKLYQDLLGPKTKNGTLHYDTSFAVSENKEIRTLTITPKHDIDGIFARSVEKLNLSAYV